MTGFLLIAGAFWLGQASPAAPVCEPFQLSSRYGVRGTAGMNCGKITVENVSKTLCTLAGIPEVRRYDETSQQDEDICCGRMALTTLGAGKEKLRRRSNASAASALASAGRTGYPALRFVPASQPALQRR